MLRRILCVLLVTLLLIGGFLYGVMYMVCKGPSETARDLFVRSVRETSAIGFLARLYFSEEEIAEIEGSHEDTVVATDASLIEIAAPAEGEDGPTADAWGYVDEDGDGLILVPVSGESYTGYMLIVQDPMRVELGFSPEDMGQRGYTVAEFAEKFGAVAAINGGGFYDPGGMGNGSIPEHLVVKNGQIYAGELGVGEGFVGLDSKGILHVGLETVDDIKNNDIQHGCGYGPVLVANGEMMTEGMLVSGLNPRTAIGQRADGAVLLLVVDGRQISSIGASFEDLIRIFLEYGAVNAGNLDGGSSSKMLYEGEALNENASVIGTRPLPTSFLVRRLGQ